MLLNNTRFAREDDMKEQATQPVLPATPFQQVLRLYHLVTPVFEQYVGVSVARWRVLTQLYRCGPLNQSELQQRLKIDPAAITRQVKQMEEEGLVERNPSPQDNRFTIVELTPAGMELASAAHQRRDAFDQVVMSDLSEEEVAVFEHCIGHIRDRVGMIAAELAAEKLATK